MIITILNKIFMVFFFMSCLTTIRHTYYFIQSFLTSTDEEPVKYKVSNISLVFLCLSIAYILSVFFTGITI